MALQIVCVSSKLGVPADRLWAEQSMATVNFELGPWIRMSCPQQWRGLRLKDWTGQAPLFKSWVLLLGLLPIDRHCFGTLALGPDLYFVEGSSSWLLRTWRHERGVTRNGAGCEVVDRISFELRLTWISSAVKPIYALVFRHRHARMRARFGTQTAGAKVAS